MSDPIEPIELTDLERVLHAVEKCVIEAKGPGKHLFMMLNDELRIEVNKAYDLGMEEFESITDLTPPSKHPFIERLINSFRPNG